MANEPVPGDPGPGEASTMPDEAEGDFAPPTRCAACRESVSGPAYEINGTRVCEPCRVSIEDQLTGGRRLGRLARASAYGLGASALGSALYSGFLWFSSYDWSLMAVLIGFLVGKAVRKGEGGLGGTQAQMIAVALTYASLGMAYFAFALLCFFEANPGARPLALSPWDAIGLLNQAFQMPLLRMRTAPITIAFVGFALWEAWKINRPKRLVITGPHPTMPSLPSPPRT